MSPPFDRRDLLKLAGASAFALGGTPTGVDAQSEESEVIETELVRVAGLRSVLGVHPELRRSGAGVGRLQVEVGEKHPVAAALDARGVLPVARPVEKQRLHLRRLP
ncbi:hypothetical protein BRC73_00945 [Halobacteriales archaeon QH_7_66_37]|nr:MAG: hypothetical protein BRC73_00945 [Halobacteriales archaeon QH_7_66_37]